MRPPWPRTLVGRSILVLCAAVLISNAIGLAAFLGEGLSLQASARERHIAERVAAASRLVEVEPPADRQRLLRILRGGGLRLQWSTRAALEETADTGRRIRSLRSTFVEELGADPGDALRLALGRLRPTEPGAGEGHPGPPGPADGRNSESGWEHDGPGRGGRAWEGQALEVLSGALRLADGSWLNFAAPILTATPVWTSSMLLLIAATSLAAAAIAAYAVWRASVPLSMFAAAAERLGRNLDARPLDEGGPGEVARAARAFNGMQAQLQQMLRQRTQMLAAMSHDLRTPLTRLRLRAELLDDPAQQEKTLADLAKIESLIAASLDFARDAFTGETPARLDLAVLVRTISDEAADAGGTGGHHGPEAFAFVARPLALRRALANLIDNAIRHGDIVDVTLAGGAESVGDGVAIVVEDDGPGLPESELAKVGEPFYRPDASRSREEGGAGLGLAIVRAVAAAHGGAITLHNRPGGGLRAVLSLPAARPAEASTAPHR